MKEWAAAARGSSGDRSTGRVLGSHKLGDSMELNFNLALILILNQVRGGSYVSEINCCAGDIRKLDYLVEKRSSNETDHGGL